MTNIEVTLHWFEISKWTSDTIMEAAAAACFRECVQKSHIYLLEPVVFLDVTVDERYQRNVLDDLHRRRFVLQEVNHKHGNKVSLLIYHQSVNVDNVLSI
jgi:translation elongation factor EF-G